MDDPTNVSFGRRIRNILIGRSRDLRDKRLFHSLSLTAFFAWVALGSDGLSSSCYGPAEAFLALGDHTVLAVFVGLATMITIFIISSSYSHIIELFPTGGGGYLVASKLLSPTIGMISGCALIIDYILTVTISIASGTDALFSFLPSNWHIFKIEFAAAGVIGLTILNMRGVKESVVPLVPVFLIFLLTHLGAILYALVTHVGDMPEVVNATVTDLSSLHTQVGVFGIIVIIFKAFSVGAGTFTGIEAVSNGVGILREPKVETARLTMRLIAVSLSTIVLGLILGYLLFDVRFVEGKTLNAVFFGNLTVDWPQWAATSFVLVALISEAALLLIAAEAGMLDGPRVLASMALDKWFPNRFAFLSDRFVSQNGILFMGGAALAMLFITGGSVAFLVVLYAINVFITFTISQLGMVRHWLQVRRQQGAWSKLTVNGIGLIICATILIGVIIVKFHEGAWLTFLITGALIGLAFWIRSHYRKTGALLARLDMLVGSVQLEMDTKRERPNATFPEVPFDAAGKTAVMAVSGFNGLGLHTLLNIPKVFGTTFKNFVFIHVGVVDAGNFKGVAEIQHLRDHTNDEVEPYVQYVRSQGLFATGVQTIGHDIVGAITDLAPDLFKKYPNAVFFGGQIVFPEETFFTRLLHNYIVFTLQRRFYNQAWPFVIIPVRV